MGGLEELLTGRVLLDRYRIGEVIGRGGFAAVYRAVDELLQRTVAVKVITLSASDPATRDEIQKRFHREARAVARIQHPNVVAIYDFGLDPALGMDFLVMELLEGEDLAERLARPEPIPLETAIRILRDVALGVSEGHRVGLIHRDIKPRNVFLSRAEDPDRFRVCVLDFGIARLVVGDEITRLTRSGGMPLSPPYASPEQLRGEQDLTPASDVFSLGVIGYQVLTRERPFPGDRLRGSADAPVEPTPIRQLNPEVPGPVAKVVHRALAEAPEERHADAGEFAQALAAAQARSAAPPPAVALAGDPQAPVDALPERERPGHAAPVRAAATARDPGGPRVAAPPPRSGRRRRPSVGQGARWAVPLLLALLLIAGVWWAAGRGGQGERMVEQASRPPPEAQEPLAGGAALDPPRDEPPAPNAAEGVADPSVGSMPSGSLPRPPATAPAGPGAATAPPTAAPTAASPPGGSTAEGAARLNQEGERLFASGDFQAAADRFRRAVQISPSNAHFRNNLGWALFRLRDLDEAARQLEEAARQDPRRAIVYANIGEVRWAQGDRAGAIAAYERFLELNTNPRQRQIAEERLREMRVSEPGADARALRPRPRILPA